MGDVGLGAETFNVDPSDDASSFVAAFELGDVGADDCRLQANVSATAARAAVTVNRDPFIRRLLLAKGAYVIGML
jgi:hypothetical protein